MNDLKSLYAATPRDEPPPAIDAAILAAAHREAAAANEPLPRRGTRMGHWRAPLAAAAMLVFTVSLVLVMKQENPQILDIVPRAPDAAIAPVQTPSPVPPTGDARPARERDAAAGANKSAARADAPAGDSTAPLPRAAPVQSPAVSVPLSAEPPTVFAPPPAPIAQERKASSADSAGTGSAAPPFVERPGAGASAPARLAAPRAAPPPPEFAAPGPAPDAARASEAQPSSNLRDSAGVARSRLRALEPASGDDSPQAWLARIAELRRQGRTQDAEASLAEFRKRYPGYPVAAVE